MLIYFIFCVIITKISSLYIQIESKAVKCMSKDFAKDEDILVTYYIMGFNKQEYRVFLKDESKEVWHSQKRQHEKFRTKAEKNTTYTLCFENRSKQELKSNFKFVEELKQLQEEVSVQSVDSLTAAVERVTKVLGKIDDVIKGGAANREDHARIAHKIRSRVMLFTFLKILFLVIFSTFQVMVVTSLVSKVKVVKKIEMSKNPFMGSENKEFL